jgi:hypothetical protein
MAQTKPSSKKTKKTVRAEQVCYVVVPHKDVPIDTDAESINAKSPCVDPPCFGSSGGGRLAYTPLKRYKSKSTAHKILETKYQGKGVVVICFYK